MLINYLSGLMNWYIARQIQWGLVITMVRETETEAEAVWIFSSVMHLQ